MGKRYTQEENDLFAELISILAIPNPNVRAKDIYTTQLFPERSLAAIAGQLNRFKKASMGQCNKSDHNGDETTTNKVNVLRKSLAKYNILFDGCIILERNDISICSGASNKHSGNSGPDNTHGTTCIFHISNNEATTTLEKLNWLGNNQEKASFLYSGRTQGIFNMFDKELSKFSRLQDDWITDIYRIVWDHYITANQQS